MLNRGYSKYLGFPCGSAGKESTCDAGDLGSIPGLRRSPGEGKGYPLQYSGLENSTDCIVHGVSKSRTWQRLSLHWKHKDKWSFTSLKTQQVKQHLNWQLKNEWGVTPKKDEVKWWEKPSRQSEKHIQSLPGEERELLWGTGRWSLWVEGWERGGENGERWDWRERVKLWRAFQACYEVQDFSREHAAAA